MLDSKDDSCTAVFSVPRACFLRLLRGRFLSMPPSGFRSADNPLEPSPGLGKGHAALPEFRQWIICIVEAIENGAYGEAVGPQILLL